MTETESQNISNRYKLLERLDRGASRMVYKAHDFVLDKIVAVKILNDHDEPDESNLSRFDNEARVLGRLDHPHIATLIDAGRHNGRPYLVLEYFEGLSLYDYLEKNGELPLEKAIKLFVDLCLAVEYLHRCGVAHRNLNLRSVLVASEIGETTGIRLVSFDYGRLASVPSPGGANVGSLERSDTATDIRYLGQLFASVVSGPRGVDKFGEQARSPRLSRRYGYGVLEKIVTRCTGDAEPYHSVGQIRRELLDMRVRLESWEDTTQGFGSVSGIHKISSRQTGIIEAVKKKEMDSVLSFVIVWVLIPFAVIALIVSLLLLSHE